MTALEALCAIVPLALGDRIALVIGLGLGTSAGWLASVPSIERVDIVEFERAVLHAAGEEASVNLDVPSNPKVRVMVGDAREYLLTTRESYDIITSEPSNPYRAGVASLFTVEYYEAAQRAVPHDFPMLQQRLAMTPLREGVAWGLAGVDGLYSGYVAGPAMAREIRAATPPERLNTDDSIVIEFEFARSLRLADDQLVRMIREAAARRPEFAPAIEGGDVNWSAISRRPSSRTDPRRGATARC